MEDGPNYNGGFSVAPCTDDTHVIDEVKWAAEY